MKMRSFLAVTLLFTGMTTAQAADSYAVDPVHSSMFFRVKHFGVGYIYGRFNDLSGTFTYNPNDPAACSFQLQAKVESVDTNQPKRDAHLKGPDFFNAKEFPTITFKSTQVKSTAAGAYDVTGDLTLHGVTKPITIRLEHIGSGKDPRGTERVGFETVFTIHRSDFGMKNMLGGVGDDIRVTAAFEGVPK